MQFYFRGAAHYLSNLIRTLLGILVMGVLAWGVLISVAVAAPDTEVEIGPSTSAISVGDDVTLAGQIIPNSNAVTVAVLDINFDPAVLRLDSITPGAAFPETIVGASIDNVNGTGSITLGVGTGNPGVNETSELALLSFHALSVGTDSVVEITNDTIAAASGESGDVIVARRDGVVTVSAVGGSVPTITITAPTKESDAPITDTTVVVTDDDGLTAANVTVDAGTTANTSNFVCGQTTASSVACTISIDSSGTLVIAAEDNLGSATTQSEAGYVIDATPPTITSISSDKPNGIYTTGETIDIDLTFSEDVTSSGSVTVTLETGTTDRTCSFTVSESGTASCTYTVQGGDMASDLSVIGVSGTIEDIVGNAMVNFTPTTNLDINKNIAIDTQAPVLAEVTPVPTPDNDDTPSYTFSVTEAGAIAYGGSCSAASTNATVGSNTLTFTALSDDTYNDCTITVADAVGNASAPLAITAFTVDTAAPSGYSVNIDQATIFSGNSDAFSFAFVDAEVGATFSYSINDTDAGTPSISDSGTISSVSQRVSGIDVSTLTDGTLTLTVNLTDPAGNIGSDATDTVVKDATAPVVVITPQTKTSPGSILDTTVRVTDNEGILASAVVVVEGVGFASTSDAFCDQASATQLDCTLSIDTSGTLSIQATDSAGNIGADSEPGYVIDANAPPAQAANPSPSDGSSNVSRSMSLGVSAAAGARQYAFYLGRGAVLGAGDLVSVESTNSFTPSRLAKRTTYYWRVDAINSNGTTTGVLWSFVTQSGGGSGKVAKPRTTQSTWADDEPIGVVGSEYSIEISVPSQVPSPSEGNEGGEAVGCAGEGQLVMLTNILIAAGVIPSDKAAAACVALKGGIETTTQPFKPFTTSLNLGDNGEEVLDLQRFLNQQGFRVASEGAGSPGNETTYFGNRTAQAVKSFQAAHAADILAPVGLSVPSGYWGPSSMKKANALLAK